MNSHRMATRRTVSDHHWPIVLASNFQGLGANTIESNTYSSRLPSSENLFSKGKKRIAHVRGVNRDSLRCFESTRDLLLNEQDNAKTCHFPHIQSTNRDIRPSNTVSTDGTTKYLTPETKEKTINKSSMNLRPQSKSPVVATGTKTAKKRGRPKKNVAVAPEISTASNVGMKTSEMPITLKTNVSPKPKEGMNLNSAAKCKQKSTDPCTICLRKIPQPVPPKSEGSSASRKSTEKGKLGREGRDSKPNLDRLQHRCMKTARKREDSPDDDSTENKRSKKKESTKKRFKRIRIQSDDSEEDLPKMEPTTAGMETAGVSAAMGCPRDTHKNEHSSDSIVHISRHELSCIQFETGKTCVISITNKQPSHTKYVENGMKHQSDLGKYNTNETSFCECSAFANDLDDGIRLNVEGSSEQKVVTINMVDDLPQSQSHISSESIKYEPPGTRIEGIRTLAIREVPRNRQKNRATSFCDVPCKSERNNDASNALPANVPSSQLECTAARVKGDVASTPNKLSRSRNVDDGIKQSKALDKSNTNETTFHESAVLADVPVDGIRVIVEGTSEEAVSTMEDDCPKYELQMDCERENHESTSPVIARIRTLATQEIQIESAGSCVVACTNEQDNDTSTLPANAPSSQLAQLECNATQRDVISSTNELARTRNIEDAVKHHKDVAKSNTNTSISFPDNNAASSDDDVIFVEIVKTEQKIVVITIDDDGPEDASQTHPESEKQDSSSACTTGDGTLATQTPREIQRNNVTSSCAVPCTNEQNNDASSTAPVKSSQLEYNAIQIQKDGISSSRTKNIEDADRSETTFPESAVLADDTDDGIRVVVEGTAEERMVMNTMECDYPHTHKSQIDSKSEKHETASPYQTAVRTLATRETPKNDVTSSCAVPSTSDQNNDAIPPSNKLSKTRNIEDATKHRKGLDKFNINDEVYFHNSDAILVEDSDDDIVFIEEVTIEQKVVVNISDDDCPQENSQVNCDNFKPGSSSASPSPVRVLATQEIPMDGHRNSLASSCVASCTSEQGNGTNNTLPAKVPSSQLAIIQCAQPGFSSETNASSNSVSSPSHLSSHMYQDSCLAAALPQQSNSGSSQGTNSSACDGGCHSNTANHTKKPEYHESDHMELNALETQKTPNTQNVSSSPLAPTECAQPAFSSEANATSNIVSTSSHPPSQYSNLSAHDVNLSNMANHLKKPEYCESNPMKLNALENPKTHNTQNVPPSQLATTECAQPAFSPETNATSNVVSTSYPSSQYSNPSAHDGVYHSNTTNHSKKPEYHQSNPMKLNALENPKTHNTQNVPFSQLATTECIQLAFSSETNALSNLVSTSSHPSSQHSSSSASGVCHSNTDNHTKNGEHKESNRMERNALETSNTKNMFDVLKNVFEMPTNKKADDQARQMKTSSDLIKIRNFFTRLKQSYIDDSNKCSSLQPTDVSRSSGESMTNVTVAPTSRNMGTLSSAQRDSQDHLPARNYSPNNTSISSYQTGLSASSSGTTSQPLMHEYCAVCRRRTNILCPRCGKKLCCNSFCIEKHRALCP